MSLVTSTKTLLAGALALGGAVLASAAPAAAGTDVNVRVHVGSSAGHHVRHPVRHVRQPVGFEQGGFQQAQYYGGDGYGARVRRGYDGPRYGFGGGGYDGYGRGHGHGYGHGGFGGCRIVIRERYNRFGELVQIRRRICG